MARDIVDGFKSLKIAGGKHGGTRTTLRLVRRLLIVDPKPRIILDRPRSKRGPGPPVEYTHTSGGLRVVVHEPPVCQIVWVYSPYLEAVIEILEAFNEEARGDGHPVVCDRAAGLASTSGARVARTGADRRRVAV